MTDELRVPSYAPLEVQIQSPPPGVEIPLYSTLYAFTEGWFSPEDEGWVPMDTVIELWPYMDPPARPDGTCWICGDPPDFCQGHGVLE